MPSYATVDTAVTTTHFYWDDLVDVDERTVDFIHDRDVTDTQIRLLDVPNKCCDKQKTGWNVATK